MVVVWAEDEEPDLRLIRLALQNIPDAPEVILVGNGAEAIEKVAAVHPSLVVLDVQMPVMDGISALEQLRLHPATRHVPVVMFSSCDDPARRERCLSLGASAYVCKSLQAEEFNRAVAEILAWASPMASSPA